MPVTDTVPEGMTGVSWITVDDDHINLIDDDDLSHVVASWTRTALGWTLSIKRVSGAATAAAAALRGYDFVESIGNPQRRRLHRARPTHPAARRWCVELAGDARLPPSPPSGPTPSTSPLTPTRARMLPDSVTALFGQPLRLPTTTSTETTTGMHREGYKFVGWNTNIDGSGTWFRDAELLDGDSVNHLVDGIDHIQDAIRSCSTPSGSRSSTW